MYNVHVTLNEDILLDNVIPQPVNNRGFLGLTKNDLLNVIKKMVVYQSCTFWYMMSFQNGSCIGKTTKWLILTFWALEVKLSFWGFLLVYYEKKIEKTIQYS